MVRRTQRPQGACLAAAQAACHPIRDGGWAASLGLAGAALLCIGPASAALCVPLAHSIKGALLTAARHRPCLKHPLSPLPHSQSKRTKKVGIVGKYGTR